MNSIKKPLQIENVEKKIKDCIANGKYTLSSHALERQAKRNINLPIILDILQNGYHEKRKTTFDRTWKYAIRGKSIDNLDIRVIVAFDNEGMLIITVMHIGKL